MKVAFALLLSAWHLLGSVLLPLGDFSTLPTLNSMFKHCKATEDRDLNMLEFFGEHLTGLGELMGGIEHDDDYEPSDKPHAPFQFHFQLQQVVCTSAIVKILMDKIVAQTPKIVPTNDETYLEGFTSPFFRPPIA